MICQPFLFNSESSLRNQAHYELIRYVDRIQTAERHYYEYEEGQQH